MIGALMGTDVDGKRRSMDRWMDRSLDRSASLDRGSLYRGVMTRRGVPLRARTHARGADGCGRGTRGRARRERGTRARTTEGDAREGERRSVGRSSSRERERERSGEVASSVHSFIHSFIRSRGGRLNFERARGGARRDVEDA